VDAKKTALECIAKCPESVQTLQKIQAMMFPAESITAVSNKFMADESLLLSNTTCSNAVAETLDAIDSAMQMITKMEQYVQLSVPLIEDGGNFGVSIQLNAIKVLNDQTAKLDSCMEDLMKYSSARADALEKCKLPTKSSTKTSTASSSESAGQDKEKGETGTSSKSQSTEEKTIESVSTIAESTLRKQALIAVDVRYYQKAKYTFSTVITSLLLAADFMDKNKVKIAEPKGNGSSRGYSGSMY
jgi:hypothetical protein